MINCPKIIVVGGNAAGAAAASKAKRVNPGSEVLMIEAGEFISTGTCEIPYVLSGEIPDFQKIINFTAGGFLQRKGVTVYTNCEVVSINRTKKVIAVHNRKTHREFEEKYNSLVLATGSIPKSIPGFPEFAPNLFTLKSISDLININEYIKSKKIDSAAVIGSGYIGLEAAEAFHSSGMDVVIIEKDKLPLPNTEPEISRLILDTLKNNDIPFYGGSNNILPVIKNGFIKSINVDGRLIEPGIVLSAVGMKPNSILAKDAGLEITARGGIKVDRHLKTSDPNIWACGDTIEIINAVTNERDYLPLATLAHDLAHIAGENAAGGSAIVNPVVKNIAVRIFDKFQASVGITENEAKQKSIPFRCIDASAPNLVKAMPGSSQVYGKIVYHAV
ncbi:MAG TPA: FAD-dependent oxidoreductase, partial [Ignavibacteriaceae bacterium]